MCVYVLCVVILTLYGGVFNEVLFLFELFEVQRKSCLILSFVHVPCRLLEACTSVNSAAVVTLAALCRFVLPLYLPLLVCISLGRGSIGRVAPLCGL